MAGRDRRVRGQRVGMALRAVRYASADFKARIVLTRRRRGRGVRPRWTALAPTRLVRPTRYPLLTPRYFSLNHGYHGWIFCRAAEPAAEGQVGPICDRLPNAPGGPRCPKRGRSVWSLFVIRSLLLPV